MSLIRRTRDRNKDRAFEIQQERYTKEERQENERLQKKHEANLKELISDLRRVADGGPIDQRELSLLLIAVFSKALTEWDCLEPLGWRFQLRGKPVELFGWSNNDGKAAYSIQLNISDISIKFAYSLWGRPPDEPEETRLLFVRFPKGRELSDITCLAIHRLREYLYCSEPVFETNLRQRLLDGEKAYQAEQEQIQLEEERKLQEIRDAEARVLEAAQRANDLKGIRESL